MIGLINLEIDNLLTSIEIINSTKANDATKFKRGIKRIQESKE